MLRLIFHGFASILFVWRWPGKRHSHTRARLLGNGTKKTNNLYGRVEGVACGGMAYRAVSSRVCFETYEIMII